MREGDEWERRVESFCMGRLFWWADFTSIVRDEGVEPGDGGWEENTVAR